nr:hypothetical protein [Lachnospiraceae bacterium]
MSKLYTCIGEKAKNPYSILAGKVKIYTLEELCYCICDFTDLLDEQFLDAGIADFAENELGLTKLADALREMLHSRCLLHEFCDRILSYAEYPDQGIRKKIIDQIRECESLSVVERLIRQADAYHKEKEYYKAQKAYRNLLMMEEVGQDVKLTAHLYDKLGCVAAKMFHYETAAYCFEKSCRFSENEKVRKKYILCRRFTMPRATYMEWISQEEDVAQLFVEAEQAYEEADEQVRMQWDKNTADMEDIQEEFCRMVLE